MTDELIEILEMSIEKHGSISLTTGHLLNILKMVKRRETEREELGWIASSVNEIDDCGDR